MNSWAGKRESWSGQSYGGPHLSAKGVGTFHSNLGWVFWAIFFSYFDYEKNDF